MFDHVPGFNTTLHTKLIYDVCSSELVASSVLAGDCPDAGLVANEALKGVFREKHLFEPP